MDPIPASELSEILGVPAHCIGWWGRKGMPHATTNGRVKLYDVEAVRAWIGSNGIDLESERKSAKPTKSPKKPSAQQELFESHAETQRRFERARARKEEAQAQLREIELDRERGKLVEIAQVERDRVARIEAVKGALFTMIARLPGELEGMAETDIRLRLEEEIRRVLEAFARGSAS